MASRDIAPQYSEFVFKVSGTGGKGFVVGLDRFSVGTMGELGICG